MISSERPNSIIVFLKNLSRMIDRECCHISSFDTFFDVDLPCGILCNQVSSRTCDRVAGRFLCRKFGMENKSSTDEMYFLFSVVSSFMRCPHVQYTMPALQYVRHALHCDFGSTSTISHSSVFPAAIIASFDSSLKELNA